jgi:hypothetical protein
MTAEERNRLMRKRRKIYYIFITNCNWAYAQWQCYMLADLKEDGQTSSESGNRPWKFPHPLQA